jgi:hypothetical protein
MAKNPVSISISLSKMQDFSHQKPGFLRKSYSLHSSTSVLSAPSAVQSKNPISPPTIVGRTSSPPHLPQKIPNPSF